MDIRLRNLHERNPNRVTSTRDRGRPIDRFAIWDSRDDGQARPGFLPRLQNGVALKKSSLCYKNTVY